MNSRSRNLLIILLFAAAHLFVQPLVASAGCSMMSHGGTSCCCELAEAEQEAPPSCCSMGAQDATGPGDEVPVEGDSIQDGCHCTLSPTPPLSQPPVEAAMAETQVTAAMEWAEKSPVIANVWPSFALRAARPPDRGMRFKPKTGSVFTRVYRL